MLIVFILKVVRQVRSDEPLFSIWDRENPAPREKRAHAAAAPEQMLPVLKIPQRERKRRWLGRFTYRISLLFKCVHGELIIVEEFVPLAHVKFSQLSYYTSAALLIRA